MNPAPTEPSSVPATGTAPNPDKGVYDSSGHTAFTSPPRRLGTSQDFGDREVSHTQRAQDERAAANQATPPGDRPAGAAPQAPAHGSPRASPEGKRTWNPD